MSEDLVDLDYDGIAVDKPNNAAILVAFVDDEQMEWVPRSLIEDHDPEARVLTVPIWWALERGLI